MPAARVHVFKKIPVPLSLPWGRGHLVPERNKAPREPPRHVAESHEDRECLVKRGLRHSVRCPEHTVNDKRVAISCKGYGHEEPFVRHKAGLVIGAAGAAGARPPGHPLRSGPPGRLQLGPRYNPLASSTSSEVRARKVRARSSMMAACLCMRLSTSPPLPSATSSMAPPPPPRPSAPSPAAACGLAPCTDRRAASAAISACSRRRGGATGGGGGTRPPARRRAAAT